MESYPETCKGNIQTITNAVETEIETAYAMILLTATLMDLHPDDPKVAEIILEDVRRIQEANNI